MTISNRMAKKLGIDAAGALTTKLPLGEYMTKVMADEWEVRVYFPARIVSEANGREHWRVKAKRTKQLRALGAKYIPTDCRAWDGWRVTLTRIAPRMLDDDNLRGSSLKAVRDGVTDALGLPNDRDPRVEWEYGQRRGDVGEYGCEVRILRREVRAALEGRGE